MAIFAEPRQNIRIENCYFYHTINLPDLGTIEGEWDLRQGIKAYLGGVEFFGKRVLDVGCANGFLSFNMEQQGAEVVSFDLDQNESWNFVPFARWDKFDIQSEVRKEHIRKLNNAYWLGHRLLNSKAKVTYGNVYAIPEDIKPVDISVFGSILLHLRDPFLALQSALRLTTETVIVTDVYHEIGTSTPSLTLLPDPKTLDPKGTWWDVRPEWVIRCLGILGFDDTQIGYHSQRHKSGDKRFYTVVGNRTHGRSVEGVTMIDRP